ncbi:hypothetical protein [Pseudomonas sp. NPDC096950]|uniref:hypothetical protein n=1 Tax=Pseudomonas sp. NPDC096950 TaxID=3364485 RepID=UPI00383B185F
MKTTIVLLAAALAVLAGCDLDKKANVSGAATLMDGGRCNFDVKEEEGRMVPIDRSTGDVIGLFERHQNGDVQLTTPEGYAPLVNECLTEKGFGAKLSSVEAYWVPQKQ